jgi:hypothetical protein
MRIRLLALFAAIQVIWAGLAIAQSHAPLAAKPPPQAAQADARAFTQVITTHTQAAIAVSPRSLQFAPITVGNAGKLTFKVCNAGTGLLTGTANVPAPFRIVSGGRYALAGSQGQDITVQFVPKQAGIFVAVVRLTGAGNARLIVSGSALAPRSPAPPRRREYGLRLLAAR